MSKAKPPARRPYSRLTPERREAFLAALRQHGCFAWAARQASSPDDYETAAGPANTFRAAARSDATFAARIAEAVEEGESRILQTAYEVGVFGVEEPVISGGKHVRDVNGEPVYRRRIDSKVLDRLLNAHGRYDARRVLDGRVVHEHHSSGGAAWFITSSDLSHLNDSDKAELARIMRRVRAGRNDGEVVDADFVEVEDDTAAIEHRPAGPSPFESMDREARAAVAVLTTAEQRELEELF